MNKIFLTLASISGALAVAIGAIGAHIIKKKITPEMFDAYRTGAQFHFYHTLVLLAVYILLQKEENTFLTWSGYFFCAGIILFSGSLYTMAVSGIKVLGAITPLGGIAFIAGWVCLFLYAAKK